MLRGEAHVVARVPIERVWAVVNDLQKIGRCVPGVESITVHDGGRATWKVGFKIGPLTQRVVVETETLERVEPTDIRFRGTADNLDLTGSVHLEPHESGTSLAYSLTLEPKGRLANLLESYLKGKVAELTRTFVANVAQAVEASPAPG